MNPSNRKDYFYEAMEAQANVNQAFTGLFAVRTKTYPSWMQWPLCSEIEVKGVTVKFAIKENLTIFIYYIGTQKANQTFYNKASKAVKQYVKDNY